MFAFASHAGSRSSDSDALSVYVPDSTDVCSMIMWRASATMLLFVLGGVSAIPASPSPSISANPNLKWIGFWDMNEFFGDASGFANLLFEETNFVRLTL